MLPPSEIQDTQKTTNDPGENENPKGPRCLCIKYNELTEAKTLARLQFFLVYLKVLYFRIRLNGYSEKQLIENTDELR